MTALCLAAPTAKSPLKLGQKTQRMMVPRRENRSLEYRLPSFSQLPSGLMLLRLFIVLTLDAK